MTGEYFVILWLVCDICVAAILAIVTSLSAPAIIGSSVFISFLLAMFFAYLEVISLRR